jgi:hypothetical protein
MLVARQPRTRVLASFVESIWVFRAELAHDFERVLPNGRVQLLVNLFEDQLRDYALEGALRHTTSGAGVKGPQAQPSVIDTMEQRAIEAAPASSSRSWRHTRSMVLRRA